MRRFNWKAATLFTLVSMATAVVIQAITLSAQILDPGDNVIQSICGVETGVRYH